MFEVFAIIVVRSINFLPVRGSSNLGNSAKISTTSLARSPQAAIMIISASACFESACCNTVLPVPNGPGIKPVPPSTMGFRLSITLIPVSMRTNGRGFSLYAFIGIFTGHF